MTRNERLTFLVGFLVGLVLGLGLAVVYAPDAAEAAKGKPRNGHGCRSAHYCKPDKPRKHKPTPAATPTPIAPGCVTYGPDCVIDLTGTWPTIGPVVIVQSFPCPLSPLPDPEPCEEVTTTTTAAP